MIKKTLKKITVLALCALMMFGGVCNTYVSAASKLSAPKSVSVKLVSTKKSKISWKKVKGAKTYKIYYSVNGGSYKILKTTTKNSYTHSNLKSGKTYRYKVTACKGSIKSNYSSVKAQKTLSSTKIKLTTKVSGAKVTLRWNGIKNASGYYVYRKSSGGEYKKIADTKNKIYKDTSLTKLGKKYTYKVVPYIISSGKKLTGSAGSKTITTANSAYLLDLVKPYETPYYYNTLSFVMGGDTYKNGFSCMGYGNEGFGNVTTFNIKGNYSKLSFIAGMLDNSYHKNNATIYIYGDGELLDTFYIDSTALPKRFSTDISDCIQLKICVYSNRSVAAYDSDFGIADIKVYK